MSEKIVVSVLFRQRATNPQTDTAKALLATSKALSALVDVYINLNQPVMSQAQSDAPSVVAGTQELSF